VIDTPLSSPSLFHYRQRSRDENMRTDPRAPWLVTTQSKRDNRRPLHQAGSIHERTHDRTTAGIAPTPFVPNYLPVSHCLPSHQLCEYLPRPRSRSNTTAGLSETDPDWSDRRRRRTPRCDDRGHFSYPPLWRRPLLQYSPATTPPPRRR